MSSDSKNYFGFLVDEISERGHTIKWNDISRHFEQFDSNRIVKHSLNEFRLKASFKSIESTLYFFRNVKRSLKLFRFYLDEFTELMYAITSLSICDIRLPVTVPLGLNARQSEIFTEFQLKSLFKPIDSIWCFLLKKHPRIEKGFQSEFGEYFWLPDSLMSQILSDVMVYTTADTSSVNLS